MAPTPVTKIRAPLAADVITATAEQYGVCIRPFTMEVGDTSTGALRYVGIPCGSTVESVCGPCARKARALRMTQCREGWHMAVEPVDVRRDPSDEQKALLERRADLVSAYQRADAAGDVAADDLREDIRAVDEELHATGVTGRLPHPDGPGAKTAPKRSTRRRQDTPNLPRRRVEKRTVGREYAGGYRPSMFVTLTCDTYGPVREDGTPRDFATYDYRRAARDAVHFASLVDRWWQNLRRVVSWDVQYFATVEPQKRAAPHLHTAIRGSVPHEVIRQVTAATYLQVWWPAHDQLTYGDGCLPVWDGERFVDPDDRRPLTPWGEALEAVEEPAHVARFGAQVHSKGILGGTEEAGRHIGYLTKYLTKSTGEVVTAATGRQREHHERLHAELAVTPCSPRCAVWLLYGVQPLGVTSRTTPGHCKGRAHRRSTLGLPGKRVLVSRRWSGKTVAEHKADRRAFVLSMLEGVGIKPTERDPAQLVWRKLAPGDTNAPPRAHLLMHAISERIRWRAEYDSALLAAGVARPDVSATQPLAA
ncbi:replication initiator [Actinokineospora fastidiosa]|uniref:replication initiator n=1 Tax=Actinokineospora fastidiosa TaxID=1816 RepID=UPI003571089E